ncbi:BtrH N-terminal domain-containing protein [Streptomyces sp. NPDC021100]|uniref:BtrH N-terminal domain-containing protein n=1 Tax=Streptomyces sp. NPDC021100 TaxID=3365114 RepID=UPI00378A1673
MTGTAAAPRFDPGAALGWGDRALDGLNCVLRCVEAVLRFRGLGPLAVARALNGPLDPVGRDLAQDFDGCRVAYRTAFDDGARNVPFVLERLAAGEPVMVLPDRYHLPGDVYEGRFHFHDHAVLAVGWSPADGVVTVLDTDADPADGFRRRWALTPALRALFTWVGTVTPTGPPDERDAAEYLAGRLDRDTPLLAAGARALRDLLDELDGLAAHGLDPVPARALHVLVLGDLQPQLFLYAHALGPPDGLSPAAAAVRTAALDARLRAKRLGTALIAAHEQPDPPAVYPRVLALGRPLLAALDRLREAMVAAGGREGTPDPGAAARLRARFAHIEDTCFPLREAR